MKSLLEKKESYYVLLLLNIIAVLGIFYLSSQVEFPDAKSYWYMAKGFGEGQFSSWYFLPVYTPETLRTWGYPFFVYLCQIVYDAPLTVKLVQLILHFGILLLCLRLISYFNKGVSAKSLFLLLLLPNIQIAYYAGQIASETINIFFIMLFFYLWYTKRDNWTKYILLALISFIIFQLRPVFLLVPFLLVAYKLLFERTNLKYSFGFILVFTISLLPFGFWNKSAHGIFKITPLEGGAGAANLGFWGFRLPDGYNPKFYWNARYSKDLTQPSFATDDERETFQRKYELEWAQINKELENYLTPEDSLRLSIYNNKEYGLWEVMSSGYTHAREKLLARYLIKDIKESPGYYIKTRLYTLLRLWFTGINKSQFEEAGVAGKVKLVYPFAVTFIFIFCGLAFVIISFLRKWLSWKLYWPIFIVIAYFGLAHIPFGIQARYTVPVHIFILMLCSFSLIKMIYIKRGNLISSVQGNQ